MLLLSTVRDHGAERPAYSPVSWLLNPARCTAESIFIEAAKIQMRFSAWWQLFKDKNWVEWTLKPKFLTISVEKALQDHEDPREAVLALGLLRGLLQRLPEVTEWHDILHQRSLVMSILSHSHHSLRSTTNPEVIQASFGLLLTLSKTSEGCQGTVGPNFLKNPVS